jgi:NADH-quinone oxidoreductase subunit J
MLIVIAYCVSQDFEVRPLRADMTRPNSFAHAPDNISGSGQMRRMQDFSDDTVNTFIPSKTSALGRTMYTDYLLSIELAGTVLLVATIGAMALAHKPTAEDAA